MLDIAFNGISTVFIFLMSCYLYVILTAKVLPALFLRPGFSPVKHDRGVKKYVFPSGRAVTYEPSLAIRKYVKQYVLYEDCGEKFIKCKLAEGIRYIKYSITIYDRNDKAISVLTVSENIIHDGYTLSTLISSEASYVSFALDIVDETVIKSERNEVYPIYKIVIYVLSNITATLVEGLVCINSIKSVLDWIFFASNDRFFGMELNYSVWVFMYIAIGVIIALVEGITCV
jgi:hypothetical protein